MNNSEILIYQAADGKIKIDVRLTQKSKDIYTTSIDYDPRDEKTIEFFKVVQNKLLWNMTNSGIRSGVSSMKRA